MIEELHIAAAIRLHLQTIEHLIRAHETVALACGIFYVGFRQIVVESGQHLVDVLPQRIEGEPMDHVEILSNLGNEERCGVESVTRQFATQIGEHGVGIFRDAHPREPFSFKGGVETIDVCAKSR